jgi:hypothetical protein
MVLTMQAKYRLRLAAFVLLLSVGAVYVHANHFPNFVPRSFAVTLEQFIAPGLAAWWFTMGGVFEGLPADVAGYRSRLLPTRLCGWPSPL